jgi:hypothetical protein
MRLDAYHGTLAQSTLPGASVVLPVCRSRK